jgi:hypothetical protein
MALSRSDQTGHHKRSIGYGLFDLMGIAKDISRDKGKCEGRLGGVAVETEAECESRFREPGKAPGASGVPFCPERRITGRMEGMRLLHYQEIRAGVCLEFCRGRSSECDLGAIRQTRVAGFLNGRPGRWRCDVC